MTADPAQASPDEDGLQQAPGDRTRRGHPDAVWQRAREAYEGGLSIQIACERAGVSRSALHERARREGWLRPAPRGFATDEETAEAAALPPLDYAAAAAEAWDQASLALRLGRQVEAAAWTRLHRQFRAMLREDQAAAAREAEAGRRKLETFRRSIETGAFLAGIRAEIEADIEAADATATDPVDAAAIARAETLLEDETRAFLHGSNRPWPRRPAEAHDTRTPDLPDSPDMFSPSGQPYPAPAARSDTAVGDAPAPPPGFAAQLQAARAAVLAPRPMDGMSNA